ncbi:MAG: hemolysin family protein [Nitrospirota bacterium]|jgi:putative hemolysin
MEPPSFINLILIVVCLLAVAVLSSSESSIIAVNKFRLRHLIDTGDKKALALQRILSQHDRFFSAVILSGNLFTVLATSLGTALAIKYLGRQGGVVSATIVMTFLTVVFGELAPKTFGVTHSERVSLLVAKPLEIFIKLISPAIWIFNVSANFVLRAFGVKERPASPFVTEEEIKAMIKIAQEERVIEEEEKTLLHRVFEFGDTEVSEAMVPRTEIAAIPEEATVSDAMRLVSEKGFSRYPVIKENIDNISGMLYLKDLLISMAQADISEKQVKEFMRDAYYIPANKMVSELLDDMRKKKIHIAVVVDEHGGTEGLVTLEDLMEEIVGGLQDEFEEMEAARDIEVIDEHTFILSGSVPLDEANELMGTQLESEEFNTMGGFVFGLFGRLPKIGEQVRFHNLRFLVLEMEERRVSKVRITKL